MYAAGLYVEADKARAELKRLQKEGFFRQGYTDDRVMEALVRSKFRKVMQIQMLRSASESQVHTLQKILTRLILILRHMGWTEAEIMVTNQTSAPLLAFAAYRAQVKRMQSVQNNLPREMLFLEYFHQDGAHQAQCICSNDHEICCSLVQFDNEISKDLRPRLERTGDADLLEPFLDYFSGRSFQKGTSLLALWEGEYAAFLT